MEGLIQVYCDILGLAVPIAFVFGMGNIIVNTILTAAFGGDLQIGGRGR